MVELVIARYREDLAWLTRVSGDVRVTVYDKGGGYPGGHPLPNIGQEAHTYLHHIRAQELADVTFFLQGDPFPHEPRTLLRLHDPVADFLWLGVDAMRDDRHGVPHFRDWHNNPTGDPLDMDGFHHRLFGCRGPAHYDFLGGGQFAVTAEAIRRRSPEFWQRAWELANDFPSAVHCFERAWNLIFDPKQPCTNPQ